MDAFILDVPVVEPTLNIGPIISRTNLHTGVWGVFHTLANDMKLDVDDRQTFTRGRDALDEFITPDVLYDIMGDKALDYELDPPNMLVYANDIILINEEAGNTINA